MPKRTAKLETPELEMVDKDESGSDMATSDLKNLILLGRLTESVSVSGFSFEVTTLSAREQKGIMKEIMKMDEADRVFAAKALAISYSLKSVNGVPLSELSSELEAEEGTSKNMSFVLNMQSSIVDKLYQTYENLVGRSGEEVGLDTLKK
jgi:hypothetical protein